jgi:predicted Zn-dependent protease
VFWGVPASSGPLARSTPKDLEIKIGDNLAAQINTFLKPCGSDAALAQITPVIDVLAESGEVGFPIRFQFVRASAPNALALPGGQIMATSGLLEAVGDDQEAFLAVIAHELGHARARDGMRAVYRNAGLGAALEIITGGSGAAQQAVLIGGQLSQLRHTRIQETSADEAAMDILAAAGHDPAALARAFEAITGYDYSPEEDADNDERDLPTWLRTHPDTDERIKASLARKSEPGPLPFSTEQWRTIASACPAKTDEKKDKENNKEKVQNQTSQ